MNDNQLEYNKIKAIKYKFHLMKFEANTFAILTLFI